MITNFVIDKVEHCPTVEIFDNHAVIALLQDEHGCYGVRCWDFNENREEIFTGHNVFLTSGGTSAIYKTNDQSSHDHWRRFGFNL